ncbi:MAG: glycosyltransferase family 39 protein [Candidatus Levybacteria bacterium]|nr:glycosyltransferase family 39 protein [Candidatus Levybacteria bacterium]
MKQFLTKNKTSLLLIAMIFIAGLLRFYNLNWGVPFYFHPDERNIASAVSQLRFPEQMNPHFFAYGSFPMYTIYFSGILMNFFSNFKFPISNFQFQMINAISFEQAILMSRFFSAVLSVLLIPLFYLIGKALKDKNTGLLAAFLGASSVGFIQFAHFGTFEMWLTFFSLLLFYFVYNIALTGKLQWMVLSGIIMSMLLSIKVSSAVLLPLAPFAVFFYELKYATRAKKKKALLISVAASFLLIFLSASTALLFSPYALLDFQSFRSTIIYESSVALGTLSVFYTQGFYDIPFPNVFQLVHIYPFLLNPLLTVVLPIAMITVLYQGLTKKDTGMLLVLIFFSILFFSQSFFFAKWTRYIVPTLPFAYVTIAIFFSSPIKNKRLYFFMIGIFVFSVIYTLSFLIVVYTREDTRIAANKWAKKNIPQHAQMLSEVYDLGILPFNNNFPSITLFDFYNLDKNAQKKSELNMQLQTTDYIILPSQRILKNRLINSKRYPDGNRFYKSLFNGSLGFQKVYETPCDLLCKLVYIENPVFSLEETTSVFDRPTVYIFKKIK